MHALVLAAGMGRRLGRELPKCLTPVSDTQSILDLQLEHLSGVATRISVVLGYKAELVRARLNGHRTILNAEFATTNTAASLLLALEETGGEDVLWLNGDVVFGRGLVERLAAAGTSAMATTVRNTGEEEVKYKAGSDGRITAVSKHIPDGLGEAVGVNVVRAADLPRLREGLRACGPNDYFEKGIENTIGLGTAFYAVDVTDLPCVEVDFPEDLEVAKSLYERCI